MIRLPDLERPLRRTATNRSQMADVQVVFLDFPTWILHDGSDVEPPPPRIASVDGVAAATPSSFSAASSSLPAV